MKTFEDCLNEVVIKYGWVHWDEFNDNERRESVRDTVYKEAALLYGEAKWNEGCGEQIKELDKLFIRAGGVMSAHYTELHLSKPPFKP